MKLKIICLNTWMGGLLWDNMVSFLKSENPDIVALQEVMQTNDPNPNPRFHTLDRLRAVLPFPFYSFAPALGLAYEDQFINGAGYMEGGVRQLPPGIIHGNAILSKYPLTNKTHWFYDIPFTDRLTPEFMKYEHVPRNLQYATADINGKLLHVFNTQGIWGHKDGGDSDRRLGFSDMIVSKIKDKSPGILCGDFNVNENTESMNRLSRVYPDIFKGERTTSFNIKRKPPGTGFKNAIVDFMFVSPDLKVLSHHSPAVDVSDHLPLICEIEV